MWDQRVAAIQAMVLSKWKHFTIWNAGKQGRRLYRSLSAENRAKVTIIGIAIARIDLIFLPS